EQEPDLAQFSGMERCRLAHRRTSTGDWRVCASPCLGGLNRTHVSRIIVAATAGRKDYRPRLVSPFWVGVPALAGSSRDSNPKVTHDPAAEVAACLAEWLDWQTKAAGENPPPSKLSPARPSHGARSARL